MIHSAHWDDCWKSGPEHYECAVGEAERLRTEYARLAGDYSEEASYLRTRAEKAEAEVERLRADAERYRWLRRKACIIGAELVFINLPQPTYVAPDPARELDAAIDAAKGEGDNEPIN